MELISMHVDEIAGQQLTHVLAGYDWTGLWPVIDATGKLWGVGDGQDFTIPGLVGFDAECVTPVRVQDAPDGTVLAVVPVNEGDDFDAFCVTHTMAL